MTQLLRVSSPTRKLNFAVALFGLVALAVLAMITRRAPAAADGELAAAIKSSELVVASGQINVRSPEVLPHSEIASSASASARTTHSFGEEMGQHDDGVIAAIKSSELAVDSGQVNMEAVRSPEVLPHSEIASSASASARTTHSFGEEMGQHDDGVIAAIKSSELVVDSGQVNLEAVRSPEVLPHSEIASSASASALTTTHNFGEEMGHHGDGIIKQINANRTVTEAPVLTKTARNRTGVVRPYSLSMVATPGKQYGKKDHQEQPSEQQLRVKKAHGARQPHALRRAPACIPAACTRPISFLAPKTWRHQVALASVPGSGNTWLRHLIQQGTRHWTGAVYRDLELRRSGNFEGENTWLEGRKFESTVGVKTHYPYLRVKEYSGWKPTAGIVLLRSPFDAMLAEEQRRFVTHSKIRAKKAYNVTSQHHSTLPIDYFKKWRRRARRWVKRWKGFVERWTEKPYIFPRQHRRTSTIPVLVVYYERLLSELPRIFSFLKDDLGLGDAMPSVEEALTCVSLDVEGQFHRKHRLWADYESPFNPRVTAIFCNATRSVWDEEVWGECNGRLQRSRRASAPLLFNASSYRVAADAAAALPLCSKNSTASSRDGSSTSAISHNGSIPLSDAVHGD